jgi:hypothetical protein
VRARFVAALLACLCAAPSPGKIELGGKHSSLWRSLAWVDCVLSSQPNPSSVATQGLQQRAWPVSAFFWLLLAHAFRVA